MNRDVQADELELRKVVAKLENDPVALAMLVQLAELMASRKRRNRAR